MRRKEGRIMKKGQALVEFIIILPVFLMLVLGVIDLGQILYQKNVLESEMTDVITMYDGGKTQEEIESKLAFSKNNITLKIENEKEFSLIKSIDIITPGLNLIMGNPYELKVSRVTHE